MTRSEYFKKQKELAQVAVSAEKEAARRIRKATREHVLPLVKQYFETGTISFPKEALAHDIDHIIREEGYKPVQEARKAQEEIEDFLSEKLKITIPHRESEEPPMEARNRRLKNARVPTGQVVAMPGRGWGYGSRGVSGYYRDPQTGSIVWTDLPMEYKFRQRENLSDLVWKAVDQQEQAILDVVRGGIAAGRDVRQIAQDLEVYINYPNGGERVVGRWMGMFPNTEAGRREAWQREYLAAHGGLQPRSDAARALLSQPDAQEWVRQKMAETTQRGTPRLPEAVQQYAGRLGKAGLDYRAIRIARTEMSQMLSDEAKDIARNSYICTGKVDWVMARGRDAWACRCEELSKGGPYDVDNMVDKEGNSIDCPLHPNCSCVLQPHLKTDAEIIAQFKEDMEADLKIIDGSDEQKQFMDMLDKSEVKEPKGYSMLRTDDIDTVIPGFNKAMPILENTLGGIERHRPATINQAVNSVNPGYMPGDILTSRNCVNNIVAYECQRNGYRVQALSERNDLPNSYIRSPFNAFSLVAGDIEQAPNGWQDLHHRLHEFPEGARFVINQRMAGSNENTPGHTYIAEKVNDLILYIDPQKHSVIGSFSPHFDKVNIDADGKQELFFARIDDKDLNNDLDFSKIVRQTW